MLSISSWVMQPMEGVKPMSNPSPSCPMPWLVVGQPITTLSIKRSFQLWQLLSIIGLRGFLGVLAAFITFFIFISILFGSNFLNVFAIFAFKRVPLGAASGHQPLWTCLPLHDCFLSETRPLSVYHQSPVPPPTQITTPSSKSGVWLLCNKDTVCFRIVANRPQKHV